MDKIHLVIEYHKRAGIALPNEYVHAVIHEVIENQIAMGDELPVKEAVKRLMGEGLDRHEAIHAVGSVLIDHIWELLRGEGPKTPDPNPAYLKQVRALTAQKWIDEYGNAEE